MKPLYLCRVLSFAAITASALLPARADVGDPVGYMTLTLKGNAKGVLAAYLVKDYTKLAPVTEVGSDFIGYAADLPTNLLGPCSSAFIEVRTGRNAGLVISIESFAGKKVHLQRSPVSLIDPGDQVGVRPNCGLGELFTTFSGEVLEGESAETADTLGLLDPVTQTMRVFYLKTGEGWREAGQEAAGDRSGTPVPFPSALQFTRRASSDLQVIVFGAVPMPYTGFRTIPVWPGRNLFSGPLTSVTRVDEWLPEDTLVAGDSAPHADTIRLAYANANFTPVLYRRLDEGWRFVGEQGDAGGTAVEFSQAVDLQRAGGEGYLKFKAVADSPNLMRAAVAAGNVVPVDPALCDFGAKRIGWEAKVGQAYQVQVQARGASAWMDLGKPVIAESATCRATCDPSGHGIFRIVER